MKFLSAAHTDVGTRKKVNQDAFSLKIARTSKYDIAFAVLCDGMGGLKMGEKASAFIVNAFSNWFDNEFPDNIDQSVDFEAIKLRWSKIIQEQNQKIMTYGQQKGISLGTTITVVLIIDNAYIFAHVGDSRLYSISSEVTQLTKDQTLVARELEQKKITAEQAKTDKRKNILLQCVGASKVVVPQFDIGMVNSDVVMLLCSDGFRHEILNEEIYGVLSPDLLVSEQVIKKSLVDLVELNKIRGEQDNITAVAIKCMS